MKAATGFIWDETCSGSVLEDAAELEWTPTMEVAALEVLADQDAGAAGSAASILSRYGSASVRPALEQRLDVLQALIHQRTDSSNASDEEMRDLHAAQWRLTSALASARSWTLTSEERDRLAARCVDDGCEAFEYDRMTDPPLSMIAPRPRIGDESRLTFFVAGYAGRSLVDLDRKLRQFSSGTRIYWGDRLLFDDSLDRWTWAERDALFERVRRDAARYGVILQRERTLRPDPAALQFGRWWM